MKQLFHRKYDVTPSSQCSVNLVATKFHEKQGLYINSGQTPKFNGIHQFIQEEACMLIHLHCLKHVAPKVEEIITSFLNLPCIRNVIVWRHECQIF